ncbi:MAG TPA: helix-turn-helix domain-containing protein [Cellulomonas sp.]
MHAATELLADSGPAMLTHQELTRVAGVSRATLYRHWPTITDLVLDLLVEFRMPDFVPVDGDARACVETNLEAQRARLFDRHYLGVYLTSQSLAQDPRVRHRLLEMNEPRVASVATAFGPAYDLADRPDHVVQLLALLNGPLLQIATFVGGELPDEVRAAVVDSVLGYLDRHCTRTTAPAR